MSLGAAASVKTQIMKFRPRPRREQPPAAPKAPYLETSRGTSSPFQKQGMRAVSSLWYPFACWVTPGNLQTSNALNCAADRSHGQGCQHSWLEAHSELEP